MSFSGKYKLESQENYNEFMKMMGLSDDLIEQGMEDMYTIEIEQSDGHFTLTKHFSSRTWTNTFIIDELCELQTIRGIKFMTTPTIEEGKLKIQFPSFLYTAERDGDKLIQTSELLTKTGSVEMKTFSKRI